MRRHAVRLADGRELIYFDERADAVRDAAGPARRCRPRRRPRSCATTRCVDEWVAVAAHRQDRTFLPPADECPLCPSTRGPAHRDPGRRLRRGGLREPVPVVQRPRRRRAAGRRPRTPRPARRGRCEVVCFTADHDASFADLPPSRVRTVLEALADRTAELSAHARRRAGLLLREPGRGDRRHPAPPARPDLRVPVRHAPHPGDARRRAPARERTGGRNLFADVLAAERAAGERVVGGERALDRVRAGRGPLAVRGAPGAAPARCRTCRRSTTPSGTRSARSTSTCCAASTRCSARRCPTSRPGTRRRCAPSRDLATCTCNCSASAGRAGKLKYLAGSESAMGVFINDIPPERAARLLRDAG